MKMLISTTMSGLGFHCLFLLSEQIPGCAGSGQSSVIHHCEKSAAESGSPSFSVERQQRQECSLNAFCKGNTRQRA